MPSPVNQVVEHVVLVVASRVSRRRRTQPCVVAPLLRPSARSRWLPTAAGGGLENGVTVFATAATARPLLFDVPMPEKLEKKELLPLQSWLTAGGFRGAATSACAPPIARAPGVQQTGREPRMCAHWACGCR